MADSEDDELRDLDDDGVTGMYNAWLGLDQELAEQTRSLAEEEGEDEQERDEDDLLIDEEGEESEEEQAVSRRRKTSRTQGEQGQWDPIVEDVPYETILEQLKSTIAVELNGAPEWRSGFRKPPVGFNNKGMARRELRCPYRGPANCDCGALLRLTEHKEGGWSLERKRGVPHANHLQSNKKRGLAKHIIYKVTAPTAMKLTTHKLKEDMREQLGALSTSELRQIVDSRWREKKKEQDHVVPRAQRSTHGGLQLWADAHSRQALESKGIFGHHTTYVCGKPKLDSETGLVAIAYSTENLLLNGYRQGQFGLPSILQVDCTHRLVLEGHPCMLFGTVDAAQHFHAIGYGLCSSEDEDVHSHVFRCLKKEMERIVAERSAEGASI